MSGLVVGILEAAFLAELETVAGVLPGRRTLVPEMSVSARLVPVLVVLHLPRHFDRVVP